jgi:hypothetical protein
MKVRNAFACVALAIAIATGAVVSASGAATIQVVRSLTVNNWFGGNEGPGGSVGNVTLVTGPATPPSGAGSAQLTVDSQGRASLGTNQYAGTRLDAFTDINFWTYTTDPSVSVVPVLQFDVDYDTTDANTTYQGRLTFLPGAITPNAWTNLNALNGVWYASQAPGDNFCTQATPCSWSQVLADFPNAGVRNDSIAKGAFLLRLGGPIPSGATSYVDELTVATAAQTTITDFEPGASLTPTAGPVGTVVTIGAGGFKPKAGITITYATNVGKRKKTVCRPKADPNGQVSCTYTIPAGSAGVHTFVVKGKNAVKSKGPLTYNLDFIVTP